MALAHWSLPIGFCNQSFCCMCSWVFPDYWIMGRRTKVNTALCRLTGQLVQWGLISDMSTYSMVYPQVYTVNWEPSVCSNEISARRSYQGYFFEVSDTVVLWYYDNLLLCFLPKKNSETLVAKMRLISTNGSVNSPVSPITLWCP